jgi:hypothetical protein
MIFEDNIVFVKGYDDKRGNFDAQHGQVFGLTAI